MNEINDALWKQLRELAVTEIGAILEELPAPLREQAMKLPVTLERIPNNELVSDGVDVETLGLFIGADFVNQEMEPMPSQIILFLENLWEMAEADKKTFREEIRVTFLHELGHFFGLDEDDLLERGLE